MLMSGYFNNGLFYAIKFVGGQCAVFTSYDEMPEDEIREFTGTISQCDQFIKSKHIQILEQML